MDIDVYQKTARTTAIYKQPIIYPTLGLAGEAGECAEKVKKLLRDDEGILTEERKALLVKEIGDCVWYIANLAADIDVKLSDVLKINLEKLLSRKERGALQGDGDNR